MNRKAIDSMVISDRSITVCLSVLIIPIVFGSCIPDARDQYFKSIAVVGEFPNRLPASATAQLDSELQTAQFLQDVASLIRAESGASEGGLRQIDNLDRWLARRILVELQMEDVDPNEVIILIHGGFSKREISEGDSQYLMETVSALVGEKLEGMGAEKVEKRQLAK